MRGAIKLFRIFGIDIKLHFSWWFIFILLAWSLSSSFFPDLCAGKFTEGLFAPKILPACAGLASSSYWLMGITATILLFVSVLLHELAHSLVARIRKIKVDSITLFFFGGVAGITKEDMKPSSEFMMAVAGPLFSIVLGFVFLIINRLYVNGFVTAITFYLYLINFVLAGFNLVPGYPLDGGRAFRAILHYYYKDLKKATKIAASGGRFFAIFLIILGVFSLFGGSGGGLWFIFLGGFLYFIAGLSYEQVVLRETLSKIPIKEIVVKKFSTISPKMRLVDFFKKYMSSGEDVFLVKDKTFSGILDLRRLAKMPLKMQHLVKVKEIAIPILNVESVNESDSAYLAFKKFAERKVDVLPVKKNSKFIGFVNRRAVMQRLVWELKYNFRDKVVSGKKVKKKVVMKRKFLKKKLRKKTRKNKNK